MLPLPTRLSYAAPLFYDYAPCFAASRLRATPMPPLYATIAVSFDFTP